ncbi:LOW QUALITY PROTEIN: hypothetical protein ACHAW5_008025 [Stephanodiscus triporus]|uniref:MOSC domain-containing protein n=1 Tax=Stephanodiscus triporus TaxID=2934178 RepID=A0ABD3N7A4_9STRA
MLERTYRRNRTMILANPHSEGGGLASDRTRELMRRSEERVLRHFGIRGDDCNLGLDELNVNDYEDDNDHARGEKSATPPRPGYRLVFTSGATESLRLVAERFPWGRARLVVASSSRNSRIVAMNGDGDGAAPPPATRSLLLSGEMIKSIEARSVLLYPRNVHTAIWMHHLLVLPMECNFGGDRFDWSDTAAAAREHYVSSYRLRRSDVRRERSTTTMIRIRHKWHILLDTAKAAATSPVDLPTLASGRVDFVAVSFYKLFGSPTGLGALFVRRRRRRSRQDEAMGDVTAGGDYVQQLGGGVTLERARPPRHFFGGGSVDVVLPEEDYMVPRNSKMYSIVDNVNGGLDEDEHIDLGVMAHGTEHFRGIINLVDGFQELDDLGGMGMASSNTHALILPCQLVVSPLLRWLILALVIISDHSTCLAAELVRRLRELVHENGVQVVRLYGQWGCFTGKDDRYPGPSVAFNIYGRDGSPVGYDEVSRLACLNRPPIQLRTGCFCNPGACQKAIPLSSADVLKNYSSGHVCGDRRGVLDGKPTGAIRASFGKDSTWEDMDALVVFVERVFVSRGDASARNHRPSEPKVNDAPRPSIPMKVDSLFVFPIKSCAAMRVNRWPIDRRTGRLAYDREFALVDTSGSAMRLHSHPQMSQIHATVDLSAEIMTVRALNHDDLILNLKIAGSTVSPQDVEICGNLCKGCVFGGGRASRWFTSVLGVRCWLARYNDVVRSEQSSHESGRAYSNEASMLVISKQSISYLNSVITAQGWGKLIESRHFRPNLVVSGIDDELNSMVKLVEMTKNVTNPEDSWEQIIITGNTDIVKLKAVGKCARCQMVDIDPSSGMKGNTLRALAQYRRDQGKIIFGTFFHGHHDAPEGGAWIEEGGIVNIS